MDYELKPITPAGEKLVAIAEAHAAEFATRAAQHDREGSFGFENLAELKRSRYLYAPAPVNLGGLGVDSVHDVFVAASRLARGDASITIGANMHLMTILSVVRQMRVFEAAGKTERAQAMTAMLGGLVGSEAVVAATISEPDQDLLHPATTAVRNGTGWVVNGRKIFATLSPAATTLLTAVTQIGEDGSERYSYAWIPADAPGVTLNDDWDALGMRASGSGSVTFTDVHIAPSLLTGGFPVGDLAGMIERNLASGPAHAAASLGIAERAHELAMGSAASRRTRLEQPDRPTIQHFAAENKIDLLAMRSSLARACSLIDQYYAAYPDRIGPGSEAISLAAEVQSAKALINVLSVRVVDRSMTIAGGGAFMAGHPLSRLYRDVRAGSFMHPMAANVAYEYIGQVALGLTPSTL